ncbi:protein ImuB [Palleronia aestuarii]|uniref:DNA-directed DNA polymerase n=1 Tax=Palleronia aestuarii TaxID=568105 RepID=A0A2W7N4P5_9RHOB|nr:DNA polymerase Y family protein [Palleronia aestuarii]PZX15028.1 protein ImuB [Palleronia aestuarii]
MINRRILSLWFPRMGAERLMRRIGFEPDLPFAVIAEEANTQTLSALSPGAEALGLHVGLGLRDALARCPNLVTRTRNDRAEMAFLAVLRRWAGKFSPWVAEEPPDALVVDLTGCAHLFGGEAALMEQVAADCAEHGLTVRMGIADTVGAAWGIARYAGLGAAAVRNGDAIDQEAPATRSRAAKRRHWERGGARPGDTAPEGPAARIAPPGRTRAAIAALPLPALRLDPQIVAELTRLGLRRIDDLADQPRAALARRYGRQLVLRLDQAIGAVPEPVSPVAAKVRFSVRLTLPDPIGLEADMLAALDRLLPPLCDRLAKKGQGARRVRMECYRADHSMVSIDVGLARPAHDPDRLRPLLAMKLEEIDAGYGIDIIRLVAHVTEPVQAQQLRGQAAVTEAALARTGPAAPTLDDLVGRLGARIGLDRIIRHHPGDSHIPEKGFVTLAVAWSEPAGEWPPSPTPRPAFLWPPELVDAPLHPRLPPVFRWRGRRLGLVEATGPERIAPEWWLDDPNWRSGVRDYWRVICESGDCLWLFYAHGGAMSPGWFCHGSFA